MTSETIDRQKASILGSAKTDDWGTLPEVFAPLNKEFNFTLDACADVTNHKCDLYFTKEDNALVQRWAPHRVYVNPPFSLNYDFVRKGHEEAQAGALVVFLIPARVQTKWFHEFCWDNRLHKPRPGVEIRFIKGRVPYIGTAAGGAPFPVMVLVFNPGLP